MEIVSLLREFIPVLAVIAGSVLVHAFAHWWMFRRSSADLGAEARLPKQLMMLLITTIALVLVILTFPMSDQTQGQVLSLLGIVLTAIIGLASTTFVANAMAGLMLRSIKSFRPGDFIRSGEQFGRVTERGLFHTEIQTEDRDLCTLPNLQLITNPLTVVHETGTIVSATLSLGYDVHHEQIETVLKQAAAAAGLEEAFVLVLELNDYSVTYRVSGFLKEVRHLLTARSRLRKHALDALHGAGIEIVSPAFMNQRPLKDGQRILPAELRRKQAPDQAAAAEDIIFDLADNAAAVEQLRDQVQALEAHIQTLQEKTKEAAPDKQIEYQQRREHLEARLSRLRTLLGEREGKGK